MRRFRAEYPYSTPFLAIEKVKGLAESKIEELLQRVLVLARQLVGEVMIYQICEVFPMGWLHDVVDDCGFFTRAQ